MRPRIPGMRAGYRIPGGGSRPRPPRGGRVRRASGERGARRRAGGAPRRPGREQLELAAALAGRVAVEPEEPPGPELVAPRPRGRLREERAPHERDPLAAPAPPLPPR